MVGSKGSKSNISSFHRSSRAGSSSVLMIKARDRYEEVGRRLHIRIQRIRSPPTITICGQRPSGQQHCLRARFPFPLRSGRNCALRLAFHLLKTPPMSPIMIMLQKKTYVQTTKLFLTAQSDEHIESDFQFPFKLSRWP